MNAPLLHPLPPLLFDLDELLAPIPGADPAGPSMRYDRTMAEMRRAREADDPSLPMGEWERPLKKADWPAVVLLGTRLLAERSKDLQVAAWVTEAWIHLHDLDGLQAGIALLIGLIERHWDGMHPRIEAGDTDARVAPLVWLNESLPLTVYLQVGVTQWPDRRPPRISLEDWDRSLRRDDDPPASPPGSDASSLPTRDELLHGGRGPSTAQLKARRQQVLMLAGEWARLDSMVNQHLGADAPSLGKMAETLAQIERVLNQLIAARPAPPEPAAAAPAEGGPTDPSAGSPDMSETAADPVTLHADPVALASGGSIRSRDEAYRLLTMVADYLQRTEPHSPTPYLIRRAIGWGELPLPQLMQLLLREEGDLNRLFTVLGLTQATD
ncbi:type VI secretion system protein ImpA [Sphaerotilus hippei]|uniref:Type VI secretion system protein ImpA n=1 Tax=Sphaerotilus hippei TaxID=744406 RepID=A0A318H2C2_9BURK|nr:type VI secretion system protein TssA [Sphaerotilus hippei]PXW97489.1 type VI secretion system protein ImpA [Sphaerotilus hippei]